MRYWNKSKKTRETSWAKVVVSKHYTSDGVVTRWVSHSALKEWCQRQSGRGRFFIEATPPFGYYTTESNINSNATGQVGKMLVYFEKPEDAVLFSLTWG